MKKLLPNSLKLFCLVSCILVSTQKNSFSQTNVALNKSVSSSASFTNLSALTNGSYSSGCNSSGYPSTPFNIYIDLGNQFTITQMKVYWYCGYTNYATNYLVQTSPDNVNYTTFGTITSKSSCSTDVFNGNVSNVRYIRMTVNAYSLATTPFIIEEFEAFSPTSYTDGTFYNLNVMGNSTTSGYSSVSGNLTVGNKVITNTLTSSGTVLIGQTSHQNPNYILDVNGIIRANQVIVNTTGADFVFDKNYILMSLRETEDFIKSYNHLPGVPSAKELQSDGMDVSKMQTIILQKIEELTLYMIEIEKENAKLKSELLQIKNKK